jgi:hypothetical protein
MFVLSETESSDNEMDPVNETDDGRDEDFLYTHFDPEAPFLGKVSEPYQPARNLPSFPSVTFEPRIANISEPYASSQGFLLHPDFTRVTLDSQRAGVLKRHVPVEDSSSDYVATASDPVSVVVATFSQGLEPTTEHPHHVTSKPGVYLPCKGRQKLNLLENLDVKIKKWWRETTRPGEPERGDATGVGNIM